MTRNYQKKYIVIVHEKMILLKKKEKNWKTKLSVKNYKTINL